MNTAQTRQVSLYLHTINDFERIGDHASYIAHMSSEMHDNQTQFSEEAWDELNVVMEAVREEINLTCNAFIEDDKEMAQRVAPLGMVITALCDELKMRHVERMSSGRCGLEEGTVFTDILNSFNRIAAHCASAMVALMNSGKENMDTHIHDSQVQFQSINDFMKPVKNRISISFIRMAVEKCSSGWTDFKRFCKFQGIFFRNILLSFKYRSEPYFIDSYEFG